MNNEQYQEIKGGKYAGRDIRRSFADQALSFLLGVATVGLVYYLGFATAQNIVGWINKPIISAITPLPEAGVSAQIR